MEETLQEILARLPGKDCGQCGFKHCIGLAELVLSSPATIERCIYLESGPGGSRDSMDLSAEEITWKDMLDREYDFVLEQFPGDPGPREVILPFNPLSVERLKIKKGDILFGRPAAVGCPVTHVGVVMDDPNYLEGTLSWCIVGPLAAREGGIEIGNYHIIAYEGLVRHSRKTLEIGRRYSFFPRACMMQSRHSGLVNVIAQRERSLRVRVEGIWIA